MGWDAYEFVVADIERSRRFYAEIMDLDEVARLTSAESASRGEDSALYRAGNASFICTGSSQRGSHAGPDGFRARPTAFRSSGCAVRDSSTRDASSSSVGDFLQRNPRRAGRAGPALPLVDIATPIGAVRFRFIERSAEALPPGFKPVEPAGRRNEHGFQVIDHVTSNFLTIEPFVTWLRDVLGFEEFWRVHFHTRDVNPRQEDRASSRS